MKKALPIACIFFGFIGFIIDGFISPEYPFLTFIFFLLPLVWAIGVLYDELPSMISGKIIVDSNESQDEYKEK